MILQKLTLKNFRQFKGTQEIVFSDVESRNVTLIHAENGFGKTALLNALLWGFYGAEGLTPDLEKPGSLIHEGTASNTRENPNEIEAAVEIQFEHEGARYFLARRLSLAQQRINPKQTDLTLNVMRDGRMLTERVPQQRIHAILPPGISPRIFFNGERIDHLAMRENAKEVTEAIEHMLGLKLLSTTIEDLESPSVDGALRRELRDSTSDEKSALLDELAELDRAKEKVERDQTDARKNHTAIEDEIERTNGLLERDREAHELQTQRKALEVREQELSKRLEEVRKKLARLLAEDGYSLFGDDLLIKGKAIMTDLRSRNMIPAPVIDSYLQELLDKGLCICERHLAKGSPEYEAVRQKLSIAPDQSFNNAVAALDHAMGIIEEAGRQARLQLTELNRERLQLEEEVKVVGEEIEGIHQKLGGKTGETVAQLEGKRTELMLKLDEVKNLQGRLAQKLEDNAAKREELKKQISAIEDEEENARLAQRRLDALDRCVKTLQYIRDAEKRMLRPHLNAEINRHFKEIIDRDYWAELSEDFVLSIRKNVAGGGEIDVAQSTGQRQITSLVFIGSLVELAAKRDKMNLILKGLSGSVYPLVMDSPFGQLGDRFTRGIARLLPTLASQVIILVTAKQYKGGVEEELRKLNCIGKRYLLVYQAPALKEDAAEQLVVGGNQYEQYRSNEEEMTEVKLIDS